ncbi:MAG: hypothetical protein ACK6CU_30190 [Deltaproteobacteria bacterium]
MTRGPYHWHAPVETGLVAGGALAPSVTRAGFRGPLGFPRERGIVSTETTV